MSFVRQVDMRYVGQSCKLTVPLPQGRLDAAEIDSTAVIHPRYRAKADRFGNLILS